MNRGVVNGSSSYSVVLNRNAISRQRTGLRVGGVGGPRGARTAVSSLKSAGKALIGRGDMSITHPIRYNGKSVVAVNRGCSLLLLLVSAGTLKLRLSRDFCSMERRRRSFCPKKNSSAGHSGAAQGRRSFPPHFSPTSAVRPSICSSNGQPASSAMNVSCSNRFEDNKAMNVSWLWSLVTATELRKSGRGGLNVCCRCGPSSAPLKRNNVNGICGN